MDGTGFDVPLGGHPIQAHRPPGRARIGGVDAAVVAADVIEQPPGLGAHRGRGFDPLAGTEAGHALMQIRQYPAPPF